MLVDSSFNGYSTGFLTSSAWFRIWIHVYVAVFYRSGVSSKFIIGVINTSDAWGVLEITVSFKPTPINGGFNGMVVDKNFKALNMLFTTNDDVSTSIATVTTSKGMISRLIPPLMGLTSLVVTTGCPPRSSPKVDDVALVVLVLVPISIDKRRWFRLEIWKSSLVGL